METATKNRTNGKSVGTLTLGILSIMITAIGLILGIIGIVLYAKSKKEIEQKQEAGQGMAIAGLICSIIGMVIQVFEIIGIITFYSM